MSGSPYTPKEVWKCLYVARFGEDEEISVQSIAAGSPHSEASVKMKVNNIVSQLKERDIPHTSEFAALTGRTTGESGRLTNWEWVLPLALCGQAELRILCLSLP